MYPSFVAVKSDKSAMPLVPLNDKDKKIKCDGNKVGFKQATACNYSIAIIQNIKKTNESVQWKMSKKKKLQSNGENQ